MIIRKRMRYAIITMLIVAFVVPSTMVYADIDDNTRKMDAGPVTYYQVPDDKYNEAVNHDVLKEVEEQIKDDLGLNTNYDVKISEDSYRVDNLNGANIISIDSEDIQIVNNDGKISTRGGGGAVTYEYRVVYHDPKYKDTGYKYATQLSGGYKGASYLYYSSGGGDTYSFGISVGAPWAAVTVAVNRGKASKSDIGMSVKTKSTTKYQKVQANKTYKATPYSSQRRKKGTSTWSTYNRGVISKYYSVAARCVTV